MNKDISKDLDMLQKIFFAFKSVSKSIEAIKFNIKTFLGLIAFPLLLSLLLYVFYYVFVEKIVSSPTEVLNTSPLLWLGWFMLFLLMIIAYTVVTPALIITQLSSVNKTKITTIEALKQSKKFLVRYVLIGLLIGLFVLIPVIVTATMFIIFLPLGLLLLLIFFIGVLFLIFFTFLTPYILIAKDLSVINSLKASYYICKSNLQWVISIFIVILFFPYLLSFITVPFGSSLQITLLIDVIYWTYIVAYSCMPAYIFVKHMNTDIDNYQNINNLKKSKSVSDAPKAIK